jgi:hypothetical protein
MEQEVNSAALATVSGAWLGLGCSRLPSTSQACSESASASLYVFTIIVPLGRSSPNLFRTIPDPRPTFRDNSVCPPNQSQGIVQYKGPPASMCVIRDWLHVSSLSTLLSVFYSLSPC